MLASVIQVKFHHLLGHHLVLLFLLLRVNYLLLLDPPTLFLLPTPLFLSHCNHSLRPELILRSQYFGVNYRSRRTHHFFLLFIDLESHPRSKTFENSLNDPVFGHISKSMTYHIVINGSSFLLGMIVRARTFATARSFAFDCFVEAGVILLFFPAMAHVAVDPFLAATVVVCHRDVVLGLPVVAGDGFVAMLVWFPPVILPVVGIDALGRVVLDEVEGAEFRFIVEHKEILILGVVVDESS